MSRPKKSLEQQLREMDRKGRAQGLLGLVTQQNSPAPAPMLLAPLSDAPVAMPTLEPRAPLPPKGGDLGLNAAGGGGLLAPIRATGQKPAGLLAPRDPAPAPVERPTGRASLMGEVGRFLFGDAPERLRNDAAMREAHQQAFAYATGPEGFNPNAYAARMAELGQAPDLSALGSLEGLNEVRDVRGARHRQEGREVAAGAYASLSGLPGDQQSAAVPGVQDFLRSQGYEPPQGPVESIIGAGIGANPYLDNQRQRGALAETVRSNHAAEGYRTQDLAHRREESAWEQRYKTDRAAADDRYRSEELDVRRAVAATPNSAGDVVGPVLAKVAQLGPDALSEGERAIWERYQQSGQMGGIGALLGGGGVGMAPPPQPAPAARAARQGQGRSAQAPAQISSQADFDALPNGAWFTNPADGRVMQKAR